MVNFMHCSNFYNDLDQLSGLINTLQFDESLLGQTVKDFNFIPQGLEDMISNILQMPIEIQPNTGNFIKPNPIVHYDVFYEHTLWTCIVALEDTSLQIHNHINGFKSFFDIQEQDTELFSIDDCINPTKWNATSTINIRKNDFLFIRPWLWKSLENHKLIQIFGINARID